MAENFRLISVDRPTVISFVGAYCKSLNENFEKTFTIISYQVPTTSAKVFYTLTKCHTRVLSLFLSSSRSSTHESIKLFTFSSAVCSLNVTKQTHKSSSSQMSSSKKLKSQILRHSWKRHWKISLYLT